MRILGVTHLNVSNYDFDNKFEEVDYEEQLEENIFFVEEKLSTSHSSHSKKQYAFSLISEKMPKSMTNIKGIESLNKRLGSKEEESNSQKSASRSNGGSAVMSLPGSFNGSSGKSTDICGWKYLRKYRFFPQE